VRIVFGLSLLCVAACGTGEDTATLLCDDAPWLSWENFGAGFVAQHCQSCHASTSLDRHEAPEEVVFDSPEHVRQWRELVLAVAVNDEPSMPPMGGVSFEDRRRLQIWLLCEAP